MDTRSAVAHKNIFISVLTKGVTVVTSLLLVPLTISYVDSSQYGIWLTLSSIIAWVQYFDLGLGNGFRNRYAEAKAKGEIEKCREYLSTTYFAITLIVVALLGITLVINNFVDWSKVLKLEPGMKDELHSVFSIVCVFFCLNMVANIFSTLLTADQKPGMASVVYAIGQVLSLAVVFILTKFTEGSLHNLALYYSGIPCIVLLIVSVIAFSTSPYNEIRPSLKSIKPALIKDILTLGVKFFIIYLCLIAIFQVMNVVISREIGPNAVTEYNVAQKYFGMIYSAMILIITPFWSAFTDAYAQKDFGWMKKTLSSLEKIWMLCCLAGIVMLIVSPFFYKIWVGDKVSVSMTLSLAVLVYVLSQTISNIYMYLINGIGTIALQMIVYVAFAIVAWPLLTYSCRWFGVAGIVLLPTLAYLAQAVIGKVQIHKILKGEAEGIWMK